MGEKWLVDARGQWRMAGLVCCNRKATLTWLRTGI